VLPEVWGLSPISSSEPLWSKTFEGLGGFSKPPITDLSKQTSHDHLKKQSLENMRTVRHAVAGSPDAVCQHGLLWDLVVARSPGSSSDYTWAGVCATELKSLKDAHASSALPGSEQNLSPQDIKAMILSI